MRLCRSYPREESPMESSKAGSQQLAVASCQAEGLSARLASLLVFTASLFKTLRDRIICAVAHVDRVEI